MPIVNLSCGQKCRLVQEVSWDSSIKCCARTLDCIADRSALGQSSVWDWFARSQPTNTHLHVSTISPDTSNAQGTLPFKKLRFGNIGATNGDTLQFTSLTTSSRRYRCPHRSRRRSIIQRCAWHPHSNSSQLLFVQRPIVLLRERSGIIPPYLMVLFCALVVI